MEEAYFFMKEYTTGLENLTLHISELDKTYTRFTGRYVIVQPGGHNEAPSIFTKDGKYYMITSGCTGWDLNAARLLVADSIMGEWEYRGNPCVGPNSEITFESQATFILQVHGKPDTFIFMADRWRPRDPIDGRYIWLPIRFNEENVPYLQWLDKWDIEDYF